MGQIDRVFRILVAAAILFAYLSGWIENYTLGIVAIIFAGILLLTSLFGTCPVYNLFGIDTRSKKSSTQ